ncbi:MAG: 23S rRNA (adenine(2503)-C(2))-methyltransferase RlmN [Alphaproteobacteria bacterium]|nr:23S rRNA (adenine(2503)-C(2))-methyltransferase RlmN [Alphaproteobacteria bacterium]
MQKINLLGFKISRLKKVFVESGFSELDAKKVFPWIHKKLAKSFDEMSDVSLATREKLREKFSLSRGKCVTLLTSKDNTKKALLEFVDGSRIETVFIPDEKRNTICVSSQVGCAMGCKFCHTGTQGFVRNLTSSEIIAQVIFWKDQFPISNIVFMGMGEPLLNSENLFESLSILLDKKTHNFSRNKITVSTCGIVEDQLYELAKFGVKLAVSLHAPNDEIRNSLMPINRKYGIEKILEATKKYHAESNTEKITFEYLLLNKVNDSAENAQQLIKLLRNFPAKVNLIVYNDWPNSIFKGTRRENANTFSMNLIKHGLRAVIRKSRGDDIFAACGQLKSAEINRK